MKDWNLVDVLEHSRHDWLNKLQLIKGNIALNRIDRAKMIIEEIVIEAQNETKLTNLRLRNLAGLFMTFNWGSHHFVLEFEVLVENSFNLAEHDISIKNWCDHFFGKLDKAVSKIGDNNLNITINPNDTEVCFFFDFSGTIIDTEGLKDWIQSCNWDKMIKLSHYQVTEKELSVVLRLDL